jgi:hypothetical protein
MNVGLNWWAFNHYGRMFGPQTSPQPLAGAPHWLTTLPANLRLFKQMGVSVVRWFILGNGTNYGSSPTKIPNPLLSGVPAPLLTPLSDAAKTVYSFTPPPLLDPQILAHFTLFLGLFQAAEVRGLQVIPSLIDFHFCSRPDLDPGGGGRSDVVTDLAKRKTFLNSVLEPLLLASLPFKDQILAWEVMNEPIHLTLPIDKHVGRPSPIATFTPPIGPGLLVDVPDGVLSSFLADAVGRINGRGFPSTVGHRFLGDLAKFPTGTKQQYHYYGLATAFQTPGLTQIIPIVDPNPIPSFGAFLPTLIPGTPSAVNQAFVGEIGCRLPGEYAADHGSPWPELSGRDNRKEDILFERLTLLKSKGYQLALVWPEAEDAGRDDIESKLTRDKIKGLIRFTGGSFPGI